MNEQMKKSKYEIDMCNGSILDKLISFSIPLMLSGILQLLFNAVDIIVVGRFTGSEALAAVGSTTALCNRAGKRDVGNRAYSDYISVDQRHCNGNCGNSGGKRCIGVNGYTG